jgi:DNA-binding NtrC family response regulator
VLITGRSGTGRNIGARAAQSTVRAQRPFIACKHRRHPKVARIRWFGHNGALTGRAHRGRFEQAENGALFLGGSATCRLTYQTRVRVLQSDELLTGSADTSR